MKMIPVLKCKHMAESIAFYTNILDFKLKYSEASTKDMVVDLVNGKAEIQLSILGGDGAFGTAINIRVENVDELFEKYVKKNFNAS